MNKRLLSVSRINTFLDCQMKYYYGYIKGISISNENLSFGSIVHEYLEQDTEDKKKSFIDQIKQREAIFDNDLKKLCEKFSIKSISEYLEWVGYELDKHERLSKYKILARELYVENKDVGLKGIIDLVMYDEETKEIILADYKTARKAKTTNDLENDMQLWIYAFMLAKSTFIKDNKLKPNAIKIMYISLPKYLPSEPKVLKNGTLSKAKDQPTTYELYKAKLEELKLDEKDYENILLGLKHKDHINLVDMYVTTLTMTNMIKEVPKYHKFINFIEDNDLYLEQFNSYKCNMCDYRDICKGGNNNE